MPSARVHISGLGPDESETAPGAVDAPVPPFEFYTSTIEPSASGFALAAILEASLEHVTREADAPTCPHAYVHLWDLRKCDKCGADVGDDRREPKAKEEGLRPLRTLNATFSLRRLSTGPATAGGADGLVVGAKVEAQDGGRGYPATIEAANPDGTFAILFDDDRHVRELAAKAAFEVKDSAIDASAHAELLRGFGVKIAFLLAFTEANKCWDWPTKRVVRDIIKPATEARGRRRFAELDEVAPHTGPATVFMSHCWGAAWGGLVMAACAGARHDRVVWIDLFAVRARAERESRGGGKGAAPAAC